MERTIIKIDEKLCNGCGNCISGCHEGALQLINGKAVMVSELYCDGLGACIGECPVGAIKIEKREAEPYDEIAVLNRLIPLGEKIVNAHLNHLKEHGETQLYQQAMDYISNKNISINLDSQVIKTLECGCPASVMRDLKKSANSKKLAYAKQEVKPQLSQLRQFPVQLRLLNPQAGFFKQADVLLAADCTAFASGDFHSRFLTGKILAVACPKLDTVNLEEYVLKLTEIMEYAKSFTLLIMEVPCCSGLVRVANAARERCNQKIPIKIIELTVQSEVKNEKMI